MRRWREEMSLTAPAKLNKAWTTLTSVYIGSLPSVQGPDSVPARRREGAHRWVGKPYIDDAVAVRTPETYIDNPIGDIGYIHETGDRTCPWDRFCHRVFWRPTDI